MDNEVISELLTDDEIVACAVWCEKPWLGPLPTIDIDDVADLTLAVRRGQRSLFVWRLTDDQGTPDSSLLDLVSRLAGPVDCLSVLIADGELYRATYDLSTLHYPSDGGWIVESIETSGVHSFEFSSNESNSDYLAAVVDSAMEFGPAGDRDDAEGLQFIVLSARVGGTERIVALGKGRVGFGTVSGDGGGEIERFEPSDGFTGNAVIARLLG